MALNLKNFLTGNNLNLVTNGVNKNSSTNVKNATNIPLNQYKTEDPKYAKTTPVVQNTQYMSVNPKYANTQTTTPVQTQTQVQTSTPVQENQSRFIGFQNKGLDLATGKTTALDILKQRQEEEKKKKKVTIPTATQQNQSNVQTYTQQLKTMRDFEADVYANQGNMTKEMIAQYYPEYADKLDEALELQRNLRPIVMNGEYVDEAQIRQYFPNFLKKQDIKSTKQVKADAEKLDKDNKKIFEKAKKVNESILSDNGKAYRNLMIELSKIPSEFKKNFSFNKDATDSDIITYVVNNTPELKAEFDRVMNLDLTGLDKAQLGQGGNRIEKLSALHQQVLSSANNWLNETSEKYNKAVDSVYDPLINLAEQYPIASNFLIPGGKLNLQAQKGVAKLPLQTVQGIVGGAEKIERGRQQGLNSTAHNWSEVVEPGLTMGEGAVEEVFNTKLLPATAMFNVAGENEAGKALEEATLGKAGEWLQKQRGKTDFYKNLSDEGKQALVNLTMVAVAESVSGVAGSTGVGMRLDVLKDITKDSVKKSALGMKIQKGIEDIYRQETGITDPTAINRIAREGAQEFMSSFKEGMKDFGEKVDTKKSEIKAQELAEKQQIKDDLNAVKDSITEPIKNAYEKGKNAVTEGVENIKNKVTETKNKVTSKKETAPAKTEENGGRSKDNKGGVVNKLVSGTSKVLSKIRENTIEPISDYTAEKITSTTTPQDKLFQAVSPTLNKLTNKRGNYDQKRQNADRTNELIVEHGYTPTNSAEYYEALRKVKSELWSEVQKGLDEHAQTTVKSKELTDYVRDAMSDDAKYPLETNKADLALLTKELEAIDDLGEITLERMEAIKEQINARLNYGKNPTAGEIYEKGLRALNKKIGEMEDQMVAELPGELTKFKKDYGALKDMEEDVLKMLLKDMKKKSGGSLYQNRGRLQALGKITDAPVEAVLQLIRGESLGKARDTNFLIEKGFSDLKDMYKGKKGTLKVKPAENKTAVTETKNEVTKKEEPKQEVKKPDTKEEFTARQVKKSEERVNKILEDKEMSSDNKAKALAKELVNLKKGGGEVYKKTLDWYKENGYEVKDFDGQKFSVEDFDNAEGDPLYNYSDSWNFDEGGDVVKMDGILDQPLIMKDGEIISRGKFHVVKSKKSEAPMSDFVKEMEESSKTIEGEVNYGDISTKTLNKLYESEKTPKAEKAKIEKELEKREADMNGGAKDYDQLDHEYAYRINQLAEEEKRIGKVGKNDVNKAYKEKQSLELKKKVDRLREEMLEDYKDRFSSDKELDEHYNTLRNKPISYINEYKLSKNYSTLKQEEQIINELNDRREKQPKFVRELTEEQQNVRDSSVGDYKNDNYDLKTTDYQDSFSSKTNPKEKGAIYRGENPRVVTTSLKTLKESGLLDKLPDEMKVEISGEGEIGTIKDLKDLDKEGMIDTKPTTPTDVTGNGKNGVTSPKATKSSKPKSESKNEVTKVKDEEVLPEYTNRVINDMTNLDREATKYDELKRIPEEEVPTELIDELDKAEVQKEIDKQQADLRDMPETEDIEALDMKNAITSKRGELKNWDDLGENFESFKNFAGDNIYYGKVGDQTVELGRLPGLKTVQIDMNPGSYEMFEGVPIREDRVNTKTVKVKTEKVNEVLDYLEKNGIDKTVEKYGTKTAITDKAKTEQPKDLVTNPVKTEGGVEILPDNVSVYAEANKMGQKRIAPDRVGRQKTTYEDGVKTVQDQVKTIAEYINSKKDYLDDMYGRYEGPKTSSEITEAYNSQIPGAQNILWKQRGFKSGSSKEFKELWKNISENRGNEKALEEIGKTFYISKVKKDISKGYQYPTEVLEKIPGAEKAITARQRYEKGLDTSFSAKDERIDYSEKDKIGGGIKSQDGKQVTKAQKDNIVKGVQDFERVFGIDMKKIAEEKGIVYVDLHGGRAFLSKYGGLYRERPLEGGEKNISVSVGGSESVRRKDKKTGEWKTEDVNTTMSHELAHAMDFLRNQKLFTEDNYYDLYSRYKKPENRYSGYANYLRKKTEVTARAFEEYMDVAKGGDNYFDKVGYWNKEDFNKYVRPIVERSIKDNLGEYRKDVDQSTIRFQKVGDKEVEIKPNADSPEQLSKVNDKGLTELTSFKSKQQAEKAYDVNKELLAEDGNPYLWTHTNKYKSNIITDFRNVEDSKYKQFTDQGIQVGWFTNNEEMSFSYSYEKTKLAPTKRFESVDEVNKFLKENPNVYEKEFNNGDLKSRTSYRLDELEDGRYELVSESKETVTQPIQGFYDDINNDWFGGNIGEMPKDPAEAIKKLQEYYNENPTSDGEVTVKLLKDGKAEKTTIKEGEPLKYFKDKESAVAEGASFGIGSDNYHYQGIIQDVKNPLVVDVKGEGNNPSYWNKLGKAGEFFSKNEPELVNKIQKMKNTIREAEKDRETKWEWSDSREMSKEYDKALSEYYKAKEERMGDNTAIDEAQAKLDTIRSVREKVESMLYRGGKPTTLTEAEKNFKVGNKTLGEIYDNALDIYNKHSKEFSINFNNRNEVLDYIAETMPEVVSMLRKNQLFHYNVDTLGSLGMADIFGYIKNFDMETNDYVFYALNKGGYDGVLFKNVKDYGANPKEGRENAKGGDVLATFNSKQFKSWNNENPTDSKYIMYERGQGGAGGEGYIGKSTFTEETLNKAINNMKKTGLAKDVKTVDNVDQLRNELKGKISDSELLQVDGEIAGCTTPDGTIYLVKDFLRDDTLKHEFSHRFRSFAEKENPNLLKAIDKVALEAPESLKQRITNDYGELDRDAMLDEVFAWRQGGYKVPKAELAWYQRMWEAIKEAWNTIKGKFGKDYADLEAFDAWEKMSSDEIMGKINDILEKGKKVKMPKNLVTAKNQLREQSVRHGSPYEFDKFDSSHMGEGEGAQAHGRGHYVAVDENTGRRYAGMRGNGEASYKGKTRQSIKDMAGLQTPEENMALGIMARMEEWGRTFEDSRDSMIKDNEGYIKKLEQLIEKKDISRYGSIDYMKEQLGKAKEEIEILNKLNKKDFSKTKRNLYEVDIPDPKKADTPTGKNYIEEDEYISSNDMKKIADYFKKEYKNIKVDGSNTKLFGRKSNGGELLSEKGRELYSDLRRVLGSPKEASKFLENLGYDGIHYFGGRDGEAYVIFNDNTPVIKNHTRYQKNGVTSNSKNALTNGTRFMKFDNKLEKYFGEGNNGMKNLQEVRDMKNVSDVKGNEFPKEEGNTLSDRVTNYYQEKYNGKVDRSGFGTVRLNRKGVKSTIAHGLNVNKVSAFKAVPDIIMKGKETNMTENRKGDGFDYHTFSAPITINGEKYIGIVSVRRDKLSDGEFYLHEVILDSDLE